MKVLYSVAVTDDFPMTCMEMTVSWPNWSDRQDHRC